MWDNSFDMEEHMNKKPSQSIIPSQGGVLKDLTLRAKLMFRLIGDRRVSPWVKLIPIGALVYFVSPIDLIPGGLLNVIGAVDDAAILWLGYYAFIEMCPPRLSANSPKILSATAPLWMKSRMKKKVRLWMARRPT
jgi:uncharacterized membrane protein YkvA (DUF1232 family)